MRTIALPVVIALPRLCGKAAAASATSAKPRATDLKSGHALLVPFPPRVPLRWPEDSLRLRANVVSRSECHLRDNQPEAGSESAPG